MSSLVWIQIRTTDLIGLCLYEVTFSLLSDLGLGCEVPSSRSREEAFASFCSPLVLEVVGLVLLKSTAVTSQSSMNNKSNILSNFGKKHSLTTTPQWKLHSFIMWFILHSCSLLLVFSFSASFLPPSSSLYFHFEDFSLPGICTTQWQGG